MECRQAYREIINIDGIVTRSVNSSLLRLFTILLPCTEIPYTNPDLYLALSYLTLPDLTLHCLINPKLP